MTTPDHSKMVSRVQALLAKAESTDYPEEAEALFAKAQELMTRHSIDEAVAQQRRAKGAKPDARKLVVDPPYASAKASLLAAVASANHSKVVWSAEGRVTLIGFDSDLDAVEMLFSSLLVQATASMLRVPREEVGRRVKAFRHAFLVSFAHRINQRLQEARAAAEAQAETEMGASLVPLFTARRQAVDDAMREEFPRLRTRAPTLSHGGGFTAGVSAADRADLGAKGRLDGGPNRSLAR